MTVLLMGPETPALLRLGNDVLLALHIGGGGLGILSGAATLVARKGGRLHRMAGTVFFISMLVAYTIAAGVAPFLSDGQRPNTIAAILALYLLITGWMTVKRRDTAPGGYEYAGLAIAVIVAGAGALFMHMASQSPTGTIDGSPPQAFYVFMFAGAFAAAGELNVILRRGISGVARIARHLWRMCFSLFIASGSFFLGQQQVMPEWMRGSPLLYVAALAPLALMFFWLIRIRFAGWFRTARPALAQGA